MLIPMIGLLRRECMCTVEWLLEREHLSHPRLQLLLLLLSHLTVKGHTNIPGQSLGAVQVFQQNCVVCSSQHLAHSQRFLVYRFLLWLLT